MTISEEWQNGSWWSEAPNATMFGIDKIERNPGYYGEIRRVWIHASLKQLYHDSSISLDVIWPMSVQGFLLEVLMMEAAILLICQHEKCGWNEAKEVLLFLDEDGMAAESLLKEMSEKQWSVLIQNNSESITDNDTGIPIKQEWEETNILQDVPTTWRIVHDATGTEVWVIND
ncbi:hypothetical protein K439DRAFT_1619346 [Ramaria rubella]|nr:hypothetical protein K439DRAFT_1619346 [Ramaria rubella]